MSSRFGERVRRFPLSRAARSSRGKGKPQRASSVQGSPVAARYRPPAPATGLPEVFLVFCKRLRGVDFLRRRFFCACAHSITGLGSDFAVRQPSPHHARFESSRSARPERLIERIGDEAPVDAVSIAQPKRMSGDREAARFPCEKRCLLATQNAKCAFR